MVEELGTSRREQLGVLIRAVSSAITQTGRVGMAAPTASALAALRKFNYERIYTRPESLAQAHTMIAVLQDLVSHYTNQPDALPAGFRGDDRVLSAVTYVAGMTDRFAFDQAEALLGWTPERLPRGIGHGS